MAHVELMSRSGPCLFGSMSFSIPSLQLYQYNESRIGKASAASSVPNVDCDERKHMETPLEGRPDEVIDDLEQIIFEAIERDEISQFYIGRSAGLDATQERHGSDEIIPLYEPESADNAIEVEGSLLKTFYNHPKCENESEHGDASISREFVSCVYLAVWYR